ncbi:MAG: DNA repair photolyase, partial [Spirochaetaceae bacterium]|nr:DNA repair photolyase [Spirochaetaceae bacterium]
MNDRLAPFKDNNTYKMLTREEQKFIDVSSELYKLTFQDIKTLIDISRDLKTWNEGSLKDYWKIPDEKNLKGKQLKQAILQEIKEKWNQLKTDEKDYSLFQADRDRGDQKINYIRTENDSVILGDCPVASVKTRCCNLQTLDIVNNCGFDCTYCSIQSFFDNGRVYFQSNLKEKLQAIHLDPEKRYHIGTGQSSDSLMWGNREGILDLLSDFARKNPNVLLELKTKSKNISWFLENEVPKNIIITWSLNTDTIIKNEEHLTANLQERLESARAIADRGIITGFHFHPIIHYKGWEKDYSEITAKIQRM